MCKTKEEEKEQKLARRTKRELDENSFLFEDDSAQVVSKRFTACCKWYIRCANRYKKIYLSMTLIGGACPILITALTSMDFSTYCPDLGKGLVIGMSVMTSLSVLVLNVSRALDKWTTYRTGSEYLKRERSIYLLEKEHKLRDVRELDQEFLQKIEEYMARENAAWARANKNSVANHREQNKLVSGTFSFEEGNTVNKTPVPPLKSPICEDSEGYAHT